MICVAIVAATTVTTLVVAWEVGRYFITGSLPWEPMDKENQYGQ